jgi:hypothetical protein
MLHTDDQREERLLLTIVDRLIHLEQIAFCPVFTVEKPRIELTGAGSLPPVRGVTDEDDGVLVGQKKVIEYGRDRVGNPVIYSQATPLWYVNNGDNHFKNIGFNDFIASKIVS